jgi:hypothetical protein
MICNRRERDERQENNLRHEDLASLFSVQAGSLFQSKWYKIFKEVVM